MLVRAGDGDGVTPLPGIASDLRYPIFDPPALNLDLSRLVSPTIQY